MAQRHGKLTHIRKDDSGHWVLYPFGDDDEVEFASVHLKIPIAAIYDDTALAA